MPTQVPLTSPDVGHRDGQSRLRAAPTAGNDGPVCAGSTLSLTASTVSGATYAWTGPNGFTSTAQNPTIPDATTAATGTYSVTATVNGCTLRRRDHRRDGQCHAAGRSSAGNGRAGLRGFEL